MEDEVQLHSLAKRLVNIYNACKWSKTKLHLSRKKRISGNIQDNQNFEEYTEVETESSTRTVFACNRNYGRKTDKHIQIVQSAVPEIKNPISENIQERYRNDQFINICTCRKCCCAPGNFSKKYGSVDTRKNLEIKKRSNSKLMICLKPTDKQKASVSNKNVARGCLCPACALQNFRPLPMKNKSSIKTPKQPSTSTREDMSQSVPPPMADLQSPPPSKPAPSTSEPFNSYYPPASLPSKPSKATKETYFPGTVSQKKCCECAPSPSNASFCCQCTPPKSADNLCCRCPLSPPRTSDYCQCPSSTPTISDCCQCIPLAPASASFGCQYIRPPPSSLYRREFGDLPSEDIRCCCRSEDIDNPTIICADKIIIPTCYFNEGEQNSTSGNFSSAGSEEVKNVLLDGNSSEQQKYDTSDKQINTSCVIVRSCTPSLKREHEASLNPIIPVAIPTKTSSIPQSIQDCNYRNCRCHQKEVKELKDRSANTSCVKMRSCTPSIKKSEPSGHDAVNPSPKGCDGTCCKCQHKAHKDNYTRPLIHSPSPTMYSGEHVHSDKHLVHSSSPPMHPEQHVRPHIPLGHSPSPSMKPKQDGNSLNPSADHSSSSPMYQGEQDHAHIPLVHSPSPPIYPKQHVNPHSPLVHSSSPPIGPGHHAYPHSTPVKNHSPSVHPGHNDNPPSPSIRSASPPIDLRKYDHPYSSEIHSASPPVHPSHNTYSPKPLAHSSSPPVDLEHYAHPQSNVDSSTHPMHTGHHNHLSSPRAHSPNRSMHSGRRHEPLIHPAITGSPILPYPSEQNFQTSFEPEKPPQDSSVYPSSGEERMIAKYSPQPISSQMYPSHGGHMAHPLSNQMSPVHTNNNADQPLYGGMVPPRRKDFTESLLRSRSTPLCCKQVPKGAGDEKIAGINDDTEAEIYATLQKIEFELRDEADSHSRNMRCIVDQVCKQAGDIKVLKVLVTGVVDDKKAPSCKQVEKRIKKLEKRKEREASNIREQDLRNRVRRKSEGRQAEGGSLEQITSNMCCKCGVKQTRSMGCCGKCCAKRCCGCCGRCCKGCCPKCCNWCCGPCEKCCPSCCCGFAKCCDICWSFSCFPHRKRKCKCSK